MNWSVRCVKTECSEFLRGYTVLNQTNLLDLALTFLKFVRISRSLNTTPVR